MPRKPPTHIDDNIQLRRGKYRAQIMVHGERRSKQSRNEQDVREWLARQRGHRVDPLAGSFAADVARYLPTRVAAPSYRHMVRDLDRWLEALGRDRPSLSVTAHEIDVILERWLRAGLAPGSVRKRRTVLQSFFESIRAEDGSNPVWKAKNPKGAKPEDRSLDYVLVAQILEHMRTWRHVKRGTARQLSLAKVRVAVIAYTGIPPGLLAKVKQIHLHLAGDEPWVQVAPRRKGTGTAGVRVQLLPDGVAAYKAFHAANAYGSFSIAALNHAFQRAAVRAGLFEVLMQPDGTTRRKATAHLYDLRHSFATMYYAVTKDLAATARALCHAEGSPLTQRYAMGANKSVDAAAAKAVSQAIHEARRAAFAIVPAARPVQ